MTVNDWQPFITSQLAAAATLTGLLFVGLSLNLKTILSYSGLVDRALLALALLLAILIVCSFLLIPGQSLPLLGAEVLGTGLILIFIGTRTELKTMHLPGPGNRESYAVNFLLLELGLVPYAVGGALLIAGNATGLFWIAAAMMVSLVKSVVDAWVLLIEINR